MALLRNACLVLAIAAGSHIPAMATEEDFVFASQMPPVEGAAIRTVTREEPETGITFTQTTYRQDTAAFAIATFVVQASCASPENGPAPAGPYIVAVKYQPRSPKAFSVAGLHDIFKEVYVRDRQGRIRAY